MFKTSKRNWDTSNLQKLADLADNPKLFWSHLKTLRGAAKSTKAIVFILKMNGKITKNYFSVIILIQI